MPTKVKVCLVLIVALSILSPKSAYGLNPPPNQVFGKDEQSAVPVTKKSGSLFINRQLLDEISPVAAQNDPTKVQPEKMRMITGLKWLNSRPKGQLVIEADGELSVNLSKNPSKNQVLIDLDFAQFAPGLSPPDFHDELLESIRLITLNSSQVRIEVNLNYFIGYYSESDTEPNQDQQSLIINFSRSPLIKKTVVIDPGHGGSDRGAAGKKGTLEKDINLEVALKLKDLLENAGANVILTRNDDTYIGLYERAYLANYLMADLFISVHVNSHPNPEIRGIEVFYYPDRHHGLKLGSNILESLAQQTGFKKLAVKTGRFVVIRETQMPGVLLELGFLSNQEEESKLKSIGFKENAALGILMGIVSYFNSFAMPD